MENQVKMVSRRNSPVGTTGRTGEKDLEQQTVESFESLRTYLFSIAYRMLGSAMDAEDIVQETYVRYQAAAAENIISPKAFLTTILTRLCIDQLNLARERRETYLGPWLPEPILTARGSLAPTEERVDTYESISLAFLVLLEQLQPIERAVFLLREVFDYDYPEIAEFLGKSEAACRQSFSRAKKHVGERRPRYMTSPEAHREMLTGFLEVVQAGQMDALMDMLAEDVSLWADGGGKVKGAATHPVFGREATAQFILRADKSFLPKDHVVEVSEVNNRPALVARSEGRAHVVVTIDVEGGHIQTIRIIANPDKLTRL